MYFIVQNMDLKILKKKKKKISGNFGSVYAICFWN